MYAAVPTPRTNIRLTYRTKYKKLPYQNNLRSYEFRYTDHYFVIFFIFYSTQEKLSSQFPPKENFKRDFIPSKMTGCKVIKSS